MKGRDRSPTRLSAEHLTCDLFEYRTRHFHEAFADGIGELAAFGGRRDVSLNKQVATFGEDCGRATAAVAELRHFAFLSNDLMDFHGFY